MNILQVFNGFSDRWNANGYYALSLAEGLAGLGHKVICAADPGCPFIQKAQERNLRIYELKVDTDNPFVYFSVMRHIRNLIHKENIDIINCHRGKMMHAFIRAAHTSDRNVTVVRTHGEDRMPNTHFLSRLESRHIGKYIVTTERLKEYYLSRFNLNESDIAVIYGGVSHQIHSDRERIEPSCPRNEGIFTIGILGRPSAVKGHRTAIKAMKRVIDSVSMPVVLKIAGGRNQERLEGFRQYAQECGLAEDRIQILGKVENAAEFIAGIDIGLIPSLGSEMICRVLMEFLAFGKPVFGSDVNAVGEVIRKFSVGLASPAGDADTLAQNIIQAVTSDSRMDEWASRARTSYESVFAPDAFARITAEFYAS